MQSVTASDVIASWRASPSLCAKQVFELELDAWQVKTTLLFADSPRVAMKACKGPGKSLNMAFLIWWYLLTHPHSVGAAISITSDNLRDGLWTELARLRNRSPIIQTAFEWTKTRIYAKEAPETWWFSARTFDKNADSDAQSNSLAGLHNDNHNNAIMIALDEAGDMPKGLIAAADAIMSGGGEAKILVAGNPTSTSGALYDICVRQRAYWGVIEITSDPEDPDRTPRVSKEWAQETIDKWGGRDSPYVMVNILGQFPTKGFNKLFSLADVERAYGKHIPDVAYQSQTKILGIDIAGEGDDRTVLFPRQGLATFNPVIMRGAEPEEIATRVMQAVKSWGPDIITIDNTGGWAGAVRHILKNSGIHVHPIGFADEARDDKQYYNKRAEMYWLASEWLRSGGVLPPAAELIEEMTEPSYSFKGDRILIEPKELVKQRLGRSPDICDAFALTFAIPEPQNRQAFANGGNAVTKAKADYDLW